MSDSRIIKKLLCPLLLLILWMLTYPLAVFADDSIPSEIDSNEETAVLSSAQYPLTKEVSESDNTLQAVPVSVTNGYEVYFGTAGDILIGKYDTLADACAAVNTDSSGTDYTILVTADDSAMGIVAAIDTGKAVTLTSTAGYVITQTSSSRHIVVNGSLILENITLNGSGAGGGLYVSGGTLEMNNGAVVTKCASNVSGSGMYLENSTFTMNGGEISDNHQSTTYGVSGGGVYLIYSTFTMNSGVIKSNSSVWGGGVEVNQESTFTMNGGEISYNRATAEYGGGVHVYVHGTFIMNNGEITKNEALSSGAIGGGVFVGQGSHVSNEPTDWCKFIMNGGVIEDNKAYVGGGVAAFWNGQIEMNNGSISSNEAVAGGGVYLGNSLYENDGVSFIMNAGEISGNKATSSYGGGVWAYDAGSQYTVKVVIGDSTGVSATTPLIYNNGANSQGGGIFLYGGNTYAMIYDGKIYGNTAGSLGGGICVYAGSALTMNGGIIGGENAGDANIAATSGGGIATYSGSNTFTLTGGKIIGNEAKSTGSGGGGIYLADVSYSITGGEIRGNIATNNGGGLYIANSATASGAISDTDITNNTATKFGGGAYIGNTANVKNVTISNNTASSGGGAYVTSGASITAAGGTSFTLNSAVDEGGGIYTENYTGYNGGVPGNYSGVQAGDYRNITTNADTVFSENTALAAYEPPDNADSVFSNIGYSVSSILRNGNYINPINNYDINYAEAPKITTVTVVYDANGGTGGYSDTGIHSGSEYTVLTLAGTGISRNGYTFTGWNLLADGTGAGYAAGDSFTANGDVTFYAQWIIHNAEEENHSALRN